MMGIERKNLSMTEKERLQTAIHEAGHAVACYYTEGAKNLYKATIVARGGSLGATYMIPDESVSTTKEKILAHLDVAMGGHVAEKLFIGDSKITSGKLRIPNEKGVEVIYKEPQTWPTEL